MGNAEEVDELMGRLAQGDRSAFSALFQALWGPALQLCQRMLHDDADAADAAQGAMMRILERANEYDRRRPALPWALGIAAWECRSVRQKKARRREDPAPERAVSGNDTAEVVEQAELVSAAQHALGTLSDADQETLLATYWDAASAVSGATLRKRRERALTRLRDAFRRLYGLD